MNLTITNISTQISEADFQATVAAISKQIAEHFQPEWDLGAIIKGITLPMSGKKAPIQDDADAIVYLGDSSNDPTVGVTGALGYHSANNKKTPYGFVYLDVCAQAGEVWTCTLSHEVMELLADPDAALTVTGPAPKGAKGMVYYDLEVCDATQGDEYQIDNITVSNFVGKKYFGLSGGSGRTNYLNLKLASFGVRPKGYLQYEKAGKAHQIFGNKVTTAQRGAKSKMKHIRRNGRRVARIAPPK